MHCHPGGALRMPPRHGHGAPPPPPPPLPLPPPPPRTFPPAGGGHCVHAVHRPTPARGFPVAVPVWGGEGLAGVPPEMLPPKKRIVRYHPWEAASTILEMASSRGRGGLGSGAALLMTAGGGAGAGGRPEREGEGDDGLREELRRLRISRPALVMTKRLTPSDRSRDKARLVLPDGLVRASTLLRMLTAGERHLVFGGERRGVKGGGRGGLPVPAFDHHGRPYRMVLRRDRAARRTYRLTGQWSLFLSRHGPRDGDAVEVRAFRPPSWQARLDSHGEGGLGMALLHCRHGGGGTWWNLGRDATDGLLLLQGYAHARRPIDGNAAIPANTQPIKSFLVGRKAMDAQAKSVVV